MGFIVTLLKTVIVLGLLVVGFIFVVGIFGTKNQSDNASFVTQTRLATQTRSGTRTATLPPACGPRTATTGSTYAISGTSINVRKGPGTQHDRIVNEQASGILKKTVYVQLDNSVTVHEACRDGDWSYVWVVEPDWLSDSHRGWIASRFLRPIERDTGGKRIFTEEDFIWDKKTRSYKDLIVRGVNKIHRYNERCGEIDPASAYISSKSTSANPIFFVTCGSGAQAFNVFFSKKDLDKGKTFEAARHIDRSEAILLCERYAKSAATHPSTVDFSRFLNLSVYETPNGRTAVRSSFTAKNAFGLELKYGIRCLLDRTGLIEANIWETG